MWTAAFPAERGEQREDSSWVVESRREQAVERFARDRGAPEAVEVVRDRAVGRKQGVA